MAPKVSMEAEARHPRTGTNRFLKMFSFKKCCTGKEEKKVGLLVSNVKYTVQKFDVVLPECNF